MLMRNAKNRIYNGIKPNQIVTVEKNEVEKYKLFGFVEVTGKVKENIEKEEKANNADPESYTEDQIASMRKWLVGKAPVKNVRWDKKVVTTSLALGWTSGDEDAEAEWADEDLQETLDELDEL